MSDDNTIRIVEVQETKFGEKAVLDSPYDAKNYIKHLPWQEYSEELQEHDSLQAKAEARADDDTNTKTSMFRDPLIDMEQYGFSDDFATHVGWDPSALDTGGAWTIDVEALDEAVDFWQFAGFTVEVDANIDLDV